MAATFSVFAATLFGTQGVRILALVLWKSAEGEINQVKTPTEPLSV